MTMALSRMARSIPPNVFERMDRKVADARVRGIDVIDLPKGNPDGFPEARIRAEAKAAVDDPANARYTPFDGKPSFLQAAAGWYAHEHGVTLDPERELFAVEGAVDGLSAAFAVLLDPGDVVAFADPYYPSYHCMAQMLGAQELLLPARAELGWLPDLDAVPEEAWDRVKLLVLNYPNNPTGAQAPPRFFARAVELATRHGVTMVHDFAYAGVGVRGGAIVASALHAAGYCVFASQGGLYVWVQAPAAMTGEALAARWLDEAGVAALPGSCFGRAGEQYVRLSLLQPEQRLREAVARIGTLASGVENQHA